MGACSKSSKNAMIAASDLFPNPSVFGDDCSVNKNMSDRVALSIVDGTYQVSLTQEERSMPYIQCMYQKPNVNVSVSRFTSIEECDEEYSKGLETYKKSNDVVALEGYDVEGYRYKMGSQPGCCFKYGNLTVMLFRYEESQEDMIIKALIRHFESKAQ